MANAAAQAYETTRHNARMLCSEVAWAGAGGGVFASFLAIFALRLGASPVEIGLLTTGPALAGIIFPLPAARLVKRRWGKPVMVLPLAIWRMVFAVMVLVAVLPHQIRVVVLVAAVALLSVALAFFNTAFVPLFAKVLPQDIRGRVIGIRGTVAGITSTVAVLVAGRVLDLIPFPINFQVIFGLAFVFSQMSTWLVSRLEIPALNEDVPADTPPAVAVRPSSATRPQAAASPGAVTGSAEIVQLSAGAQPIAAAPPSVTDRPKKGAHPQDAARPRVAARVPLLSWRAPFWRFTAGAVVLMLGIYVPAALYPLVLVDRLHASNGWIGALGTGGGVCGVVLSLLWARGTARFGSRPLLVVICALYALVPLGADHATGLAAYIPVALAQGGLGAVLGMGVLQVLLDVAPERQQTQYIAIYSMLANCAVAGAPLLGTFVLSTAGMSTGFVMAAGFTAIGSIILALSGVKLSPQEADQASFA